MIDVDRYLARIGFDAPPPLDRDGLEALQRAHLSAVPFENLHVFTGLGVRTDVAWSVPKIVEGGRGGWCFEANGAFAELLGALGFSCARLGAAVLLGGPSHVIDHLCIEVMLDEPYLVDVGFGDSFIRPLALNRRGPQDGGTATYELIDSSQGVTLTEHVEGVPEARYRFRRVNRTMSDFDEASDRLQSDGELHWSQKPFATRLLAGGPDRVWLLSDRLKIRRDAEIVETPIAAENWGETLEDWFGMTMPATPEPQGDEPLDELQPIGVELRRAGAGDDDLVRRVLSLAVGWRHDSPPPVLPAELDPYHEGWPRPDDIGMLAFLGVEFVGGAFARRVGPADGTHGFVSPDLWELTIGVESHHRRRGIGRLLLETLKARCLEMGIAGLSLSVELDNPARHLYESARFTVVAERGTDVVMEWLGPTAIH